MTGRVWLFALAALCAYPTLAHAQALGYFEAAGDVGSPAIKGSTTYDPQAQSYTITGGGTGALNINFTNVSPEVVSAILTKTQGGAELDASGADVTIGQMTYNCPPVGQCSKVVLARPL